MNALNGWLKKPLLPDRHRAERRITPGLAAYHSAGSTQRQDSIRDISSTGVYLLTEERPARGAVVSLTLQREGPLEMNSGRRIAVQARAVRCGEDGIGLSFVLPKGMDLRLWESSTKAVAEQPDPEDVLQEFRMAKALAFVQRICPSSGNEAAQLLHEGLSNYRIESAVDIALIAEELLAAGPDADKMRAHPHLLLRILEDGSWAEAEWIRQFWAGLLVTSCTVEGTDESNLVFIDLLSQLTTIHTRIFAAACSKATKVMTGPGSISAQPLVCTAEEMIQIAGSHDLIRIDRDLEHLYDLGLLEKRVKSTFFSVIDDTLITPTTLALQLYARCNGHRGATEDFYGLVSPELHVTANE
jgi:hypothetical protein